MYNPVFSPDCRLIATTPLPNSIAGCDALFLWERSTGRLLNQLGDPHAYQGALFHRYVFSPDGRSVVAGDPKGTSFRSWDLESGEELWRIVGPATGVGALTVSPDGNILACGDDKGVIRLWDVRHQNLVNTLPGLQAPIKALAFTADSRRLISLNEQDCVQALAVDSGKVLLSFRVPQVTRIVLAPDGRSLAVRKADELTLWDVATGERRLLFSQEKDYVAYELSFSPDGKTMLAADARGQAMHLWDVGTGKRLRKILLPGLTDENQAVSLSPDGKTLAAPATHASVLRLWDAATGMPRLAFPGHTLPPTQLAYSADGKALVSHNFNDGIFCWDIKTGRLVSQVRTRYEDLYAEPSPTLLLRLAPEGQWAGLAQGRKVDLYDTATGKTLHTLRGHEKSVIDMAFQRSGKMLATATEDGAVRVWDTATGQCVRALDRGNVEVCWVLFTPDDKTLATGSLPLRVDFWDAATGKHLATIKGSAEDRKRTFKRQDWTCCFAPDAKTLYTSNSGNFLTWDVTARRTVSPFDPEVQAEWRTSATGPVAATPDGRLLARFDDTFTLQVWETASGRKVHRFKGNYASVAFSPDGLTLAVGCNEDGSILLWNVMSLLRPAYQVPRGRQACWDDLASADAGRAYRAIGQLVADETAAIALFNERLRPIARADPAHLTMLLRDLDSEMFDVREAAVRRLEDCREAAKPFLERIDLSRVSPEVRRRVGIILEQLRPGSSECLREVRAVQVLEYLGSSSARRLLLRLADGIPDARLTAEAVAAVERLTRRQPRGE
jgi:WD40 repeat protein